MKFLLPKVEKRPSKPPLSGFNDSELMRQWKEEEAKRKAKQPKEKGEAAHRKRPPSVLKNGNKTNSHNTGSTASNASNTSSTNSPPLRVGVGPGVPHPPANTTAAAAAAAATSVAKEAAANTTPAPAHAPNAPAEKQLMYKHTVIVNKAKQDSPLGVSIRGLHPDILISAVVPNGLTSKSGLEQGMKIGSVDGKPFDSAEDTIKYLRTTTGDVAFVVYSDKAVINKVKTGFFARAAKTVGVKLNPDGTSTVTIQKDKPETPLGISLRGIHPDIFFSAVVADSLASKSGLEQGMKLISIDTKVFRTAEATIKYLKAAKGDVVLVVDSRNNNNDDPTEVSNGEKDAKIAKAKSKRMLDTKDDDEDNGNKEEKLEEETNDKDKKLEETKEEIDKDEKKTEETSEEMAEETERVEEENNTETVDNEKPPEATQGKDEKPEDAASKGPTEELPELTPESEIKKVDELNESANKSDIKEEPKELSTILAWTKDVTEEDPENTISADDDDDDDDFTEDHPDDILADSKAEQEEGSEPNESTTAVATAEEEEEDTQPPKNDDEVPNEDVKDDASKEDQDETNNEDDEDEDKPTNDKKERVTKIVPLNDTKKKKKAVRKTLSLSAAPESCITVATVVKPQRDAPLGISLRGFHPTIMISVINPQSLVGETPLKVGMTILRINGKTFTSGEQAVYYLRNSEGEITFEATEDKDQQAS